LFVTLDELFVEGLVHVSELGGEYFQFNEAAHELRGERTGRRFRLTDEIGVQVSRVDLEARRIEFRMVPRGPIRPRTTAPIGVNGGDAAMPPGLDEAVGAVDADRPTDARTPPGKPVRKSASKAAPAKTEAVERARAERLSARRKRVSPPRRKGPSARRGKRR
jgi:ribonuclease R